MANVTNQIPIVIDTAGTGLVMTRTIEVIMLVLTSPTNNSTCLLKDASGNTMFAIDAWNQGMGNWFEWPNYTTLTLAGGFSVNSLSAGRLLIYPY